MWLERWRDVTGGGRERESRRTDLGRIVLFGDRSGTWWADGRLDETEQSVFAGLEEPFAVAHKVYLHTILQERNSDAAPHAAARRTAARLFQKMEHVMQRVVNLRWQAACRQRHSTGGQSVQTFRRRWEAPGLVVIPSDERAANLIMFKREITRERWKGKRLDEHAKRFRTQQHSPPLELPPDAVSIFTGSAADKRKLGEPLPPAGYGFHVTEGGRGHEHAGGRSVAEEGGQINMDTPNVQTITGNLARRIGCIHEGQDPVGEPALVHGGQARVRAVQQRVRGDGREWHVESKEAQGDGGGSARRVAGAQAPGWGTAVAAPRREARRASMGAWGERARRTREARHSHAGRAHATVTTRLSRVTPRLPGGGHRPLGVGGPTRHGGDATNSNLWCVWWWVEGPIRPLRGTQWRCAAVLACATARAG